MIVGVTVGVAVGVTVGVTVGVCVGVGVANDQLVLFPESTEKGADIMIALVLLLFCTST